MPHPSPSNQHATPTGMDKAVSAKVGVAGPLMQDRAVTETLQGSGLQEDMNDGSLPGSEQEPITGF